MVLDGLLNCGSEGLANQRLYSCNLHERESENLSWTAPGKSLKSIKGDALRQQDASYGVDAAETEVAPEILKSLCEDYLSRLQVSKVEATAIAERTALQADDDTGEWSKQRKGRLTASKFGEVARRRAAYAPLTIRYIYGRMRDIPALRYGRHYESEARTAYEEQLKSNHPGAKVDTTGVHIDTTHCWLAASPDGFVFDPLATNPEGLLEIKCPFSAKDKSDQCHQDWIADIDSTRSTISSTTNSTASTVINSSASDIRNATRDSLL